MGFVTLEDVSGTIELVVFPRTWDKYWEVFEVDNVVLVDGKVDAQSGDPKVLVDSVTTDLKTITSVPPPLPAEATSSTSDSYPEPSISTPRITLPPAGISHSEPASQEDDWGDMPEPPDNFISDWQVNEMAPGGFVVERGVISAEAPMPVIEAAISVSGKPYRSKSNGTEEHEPDTKGEPSANINEQITTDSEESLSEVIMSESTPDTIVEAPNTPIEPMIPSAMEVELPAGDGITISSPTTVGAAVIEPTASPPPIVVSNESTIAAPPYILPPTEAYAGQEMHMITVILRPGGDKVRDNLRLRQCYGILISYSGHDRFAVQIFERSRGYRIEFPNYTTTYCAELVARLGRIVGQDNVIVEPLRLH
jgi:DNA polymerase-3 subunit alpha